jgi:DNA polymerase
LVNRSETKEIAVLAESLKRHLQRRQQAGIHILANERPDRVIKQDRAGESQHSASAQADLYTKAPSFSAKNLDGLRSEIGDCRRCKLCSGRNNIVFGIGNPHARLMFVGEGPGRDEDLQGEPFVGRAGQLLTDIITKGMGLQREDVYIANVVKCRPPENRNPEPDEVTACEPFLKKQIDLVRPQVIVGLGKFAVQTLLQSKVPITKLRGIWHRYQGIKLMPTFHPAYLLRNPADKKLVWEDIKKVIEELRGEST